MKKSYVKIGMKVVPFKKTVKGWKKLSESKQWEQAKAIGYMYVVGWEDEEKCWILSVRSAKNNPYKTGDFFNSGDFKPYDGKK